MLERLIIRLSEKRRLHDLPVAVWVVTPSDDRIAFGKLDAALRLIQQLAPEKFQAVQKDVHTILVAGLPTYRGCYVHRLRLIELERGYVLDRETTPESIACVLVHEAQHARLWRLGFCYDEPIRGRVEGLCYRAQRNFARLLTNGEDLVAEAEAWMSVGLDTFFSNASVRQRKLGAMKELGFPRWTISAMAWVYSLRYS
jgi:hypothetical protein